MPLFIPVPNTAEVHIRGTLNGAQVENTLYFHRAAGWDAINIGLLASAVNTWFYVGIRSGLSNEYVFREVYAVDLTTAFGVTSTDATHAGTTGGESSEASSNQASFVVKFLTGFRGRSYRGRNYVAGIPESKVSASAVNTTFESFILSQYDGLKYDFGLLGYQWCVVSRYAAGAPRTYGISTEIISVAATTRVLGSQRGRRPI
jgi:hypothetical protein